MSLSSNRMEAYIQKIISPKIGSPERVESYQTLIKIFQEENELSPTCASNSELILHALKQDISSDVVKLSQESLHFLGIILHSEKVIKSLNENRLRDIIDELCNLALTSTEKTICTRSLWCLARQKIPTHICIEKLDKIMELIEQQQDPKQSSSSLELEVIRVLNRLVVEIPDSLAIRLNWARRLYLATVHPAPKVREAALIVLSAARPYLCEQQQLLTTLVPDLKEILVPGLLKLFKEKHELFSLKLWNLLLEILGKTLHQGASLINNLLAIVEKAFKSPVVEIKIEAFNSWQQLIKNFGTELDVLANPKRLRLVMQPLKANNARTEQVACIKFRIWWYLANSLGPKLTSNFETVLYPFLQFCFGLNDAICNQSSFSNNSSRTSDSIQKVNLNTTINSQTSPGSNQRYPVVHQLGCDALIQILSHNFELPVSRPTISIDVLKHPALEPSSLFIRHARILILSAKEAIIGVGNGKKDLHLQLYLWHSVVAHIKNNSDSENEKEFSEAFTLFLSVIEDFVIKCDAISPEVSLKLLEASTFVPETLLNSSLHTIGESSLLNGTPTLFMIDLLFKSDILNLCTTERFGTIFQKLLFEGINCTASPLNFVQSVIKSIDSVSDSIQHSETLFSLWSTVAVSLLRKIEETQEINQGDNLEHDFSCLIAVLIFPINHLLMKPLLQSSLNKLTRNWSDLCRTLSKCSTLVPTVEANAWCEELCSKILGVISQDTLKISLMQGNMSAILNEITSSVDFSSISLNPIVSTSPTNWLTRKNNPLGYLSSLVTLIDKLMSAINEIGLSSPLEENSMKLQSTRSVCVALSNLADVILTLFMRISMSSASLVCPLISKLVSPMCHLFTAATRNEGCDTQQVSIATKVEEMWNVVINCIQNHYVGPYDSEFLCLISPLLEASLLYPGKNIRVKTRMLWHTTFARSQETLQLPDALKAVLKQIRPSLVPGLDGDDDAVLDLLPQENLEDGQTQKQSREIKINFSNDNEIDQENIRGTTSQKRTSVEDMVDDEFVKILPDPKRKRVLTERQKELLTTRKSALPALYADLTQDSNPQLPPQFVESESQLTSQQSVSTVDEVIEKENSKNIEKMETQLSTNSVSVIGDKVLQNAQKVSDSACLKSSDASLESLNETLTEESKSSPTALDQQQDVDNQQNISDEKLLADPVLEIKRLSDEEIVHLSNTANEEPKDDNNHSEKLETHTPKLVEKNISKNCDKKISKKNRTGSVSPVRQTSPKADVTSPPNSASSSPTSKKLDKNDVSDNSKSRETLGSNTNETLPISISRRRKRRITTDDMAVPSASAAQKETQRSNTASISPMKTRKRKRSKYDLTCEDVPVHVQEKSTDLPGGTEPITSAQTQESINHSPVSNINSQLPPSVNGSTPPKVIKTARKSFQSLVVPPIDTPSSSKSYNRSERLTKKSRKALLAEEVEEFPVTKSRQSTSGPSRSKRERKCKSKSDSENSEQENVVCSDKNESCEDKKESASPSIEFLVTSPILNEVELSNENETGNDKQTEYLVPKVLDKTFEKENMDNTEKPKKGTTSADEETSKTHEEQVEVEPQEVTIGSESEVIADVSPVDTIVSTTTTSEPNKIPVIGSEVTVDCELSSSIANDESMCTKENVVMFVSDSAAEYTETVTTEVNTDSTSSEREEKNLTPVQVPICIDPTNLSVKDEVASPVKPQRTHKKISLSPYKKQRLTPSKDGSSTKIHREEDDALNFNACRNTKTYSRDGSRILSSNLESSPSTSSSNSTPPISSLPANSPLLQRVGSRAMKMLEAANKQNIQYERMKYETKRSPEKSPENKKISMSKSLETLTSAGGKNTESPERSKLNLNKSTDSKISPTASPTLGILKKQQLERKLPFTSTGAEGTGNVLTSPVPNKRRVSFAYPLVQKSENTAVKSDGKLPVSRSLEMNQAAGNRQKISKQTVMKTLRGFEKLASNAVALKKNAEAPTQGIPASKSKNNDVPDSSDNSSDVTVGEPANQENIVTESVIVEQSGVDAFPPEATTSQVQNPLSDVFVDGSSESSELTTGNMISNPDVIISHVEEIGATEVVMEKSEEASQISNFNQPEIGIRIDGDIKMTTSPTSQDNLSVIPEVQMEILLPHTDSTGGSEIENDKEETISNTKQVFDKTEQPSNDLEPVPRKKRRLNVEELGIFELTKIAHSKFTTDELCKLPSSEMPKLQELICNMAMAVTNVLATRARENDPN